MSDIMLALVGGGLIFSPVWIPLVIFLNRKRIRAWYAERQFKQDVIDAQARMERGQYDADVVRTAFLKNYGIEAYIERFGYEDYLYHFGGEVA